MNMNEEVIKALKDAVAAIESQKDNVLEKQSEAKQSIDEKEFIDRMLTNCAKYLKDAREAKDYNPNDPERLNAFMITRVLSVALAFEHESLILHKLLNKINEL